MLTLTLITVLLQLRPIILFDDDKDGEDGFETEIFGLIMMTAREIFHKSYLLIELLRLGEGTDC